jgi:hypothetical protein
MENWLKHFIVSIGKTILCVVIVLLVCALTAKAFGMDSTVSYIAYTMAIFSIYLHFSDKEE